MTQHLPSLESLRTEEERLAREITRRKGQLFSNQPCGDIGSLAVRLSDVRKVIAEQTLCQMRTA